MTDFFDRASAVYGHEYDLSLVSFVGNSVPVQIICPDHGPFHTTPDNFLYNAGCPLCRGSHSRGYPSRVNRVGRRRKGRPEVGYSFYIHHVSGGFLKIGVTSGCVEARRVQIENASKFCHTVVYVRAFKSRRICEAVERLVKASYPMRVAPAGSMNDGITETTREEFLAEIITLVESVPERRR